METVSCPRCKKEDVVLVPDPELFKCPHCEAPLRVKTVLEFVGVPQMQSEAAIKEQIAKIESDDSYQEGLKSPATVDFNAPLALIQLEMETKLATLHWVLNEREIIKEESMANLACPHCDKDIDSDVGEFLTKGSGGPDPELMKCPYCEGLIRVKTVVEKYEGGK